MSAKSERVSLTTFTKLMCTIHTLTLLVYAEMGTGEKWGVRMGSNREQTCRARDLQEKERKVRKNEEPADSDGLLC